MNDQSSEQLLHRFLQGPAAAASEWLRSVDGGEASIPSDFNWLGLAEGSAGLATSTDDVEWGRVAVNIYERLAAGAEPRLSDRLLHSAMLVRAHFIALLGDRSDDPLLDADRIVRWFLDGLQLPPDEARRRADIWPTLSAPEILSLRDIKIRLSPLVMLAEAGLLREHPELDRWLQLRPALP